MRRTCGETWIPAERIDCFVEIDTPVAEYVALAAALRPQRSAGAAAPAA